MNIKQAKQEILNTLKAYLARDGLGNYLIPSVRQRPVLLMGPPGIGKTQIMESDLPPKTGWGWSPIPITHHTRAKRDWGFRSLSTAATAARIPPSPNTR